MENLIFCVVTDDFKIVTLRQRYKSISARTVVINLRLQENLMTPIQSFAWLSHSFYSITFFVIFSLLIKK